jgi:protein SCO1/2
MTDKTPRKTPSRTAVVLGVIAVLLAVAGGGYFSIGPERLASMFGGKPEISNVPIGGPFTLTDQNGKPRTQADFAGKLMLIYFGYTYCPDVCPTSLTTMTDALKILGPKADRIVPVFITVDPARDTVDQMKMYVEHFDPRFVGLTGTPEQVVAAAKTYRVYFAKQKDAAAGSEDYLVDHTSITYLMDRQGRFLTHFGHAVTAEAMAERIRKYL